MQPRMIVPPSSDVEYGSSFELDDELIQTLDAAQDVFAQEQISAVLSLASTPRRLPSESSQDDEDSPLSSLPVASDDSYDARTVPSTLPRLPSTHFERHTTPRTRKQETHNMILRTKVTPAKKATATTRRAALARQQLPESPATQPDGSCSQLPDSPPQSPSPKESSRQEPSQAIPVDVEHIDALRSTPPTPVNTPMMVPGALSIVEGNISLDLSARVPQELTYHFPAISTGDQISTVRPVPGLVDSIMVPQVPASSIVQLLETRGEQELRVSGVSSASAIQLPRSSTVQVLHQDGLDVVQGPIEEAYFTDALLNTDRPSDEVLAILQDGFSDINKRFTKLAGETGLSVEAVLSRWNMQHGHDQNLWNLYQQYFKHNAEIELGRINMKVPPGGPKDINSKSIVQCFTLFKDAYEGSWEEILKVSAQLDDLEDGDRTTEQQRHRAFRQVYKQISNIVSLSPIARFRY